MVGIKCSTPCLGAGLEKEGVVTSGKSANILPYSSSAEAMELRCGTAAVTLCRVIDV